MTIII